MIVFDKNKKTIGDVVKYNLYFFLAIINLTFYIETRSIHRPNDPNIGYIEIKSENSPSYFFKDSHLRPIPLFQSYNHEYFLSKQLPDIVEYRENKNEKVSKEILEKKIENLLEEIKNKKRKFSDFIILKQRDFNRFNCSGLLVLKFKDFPFVLKIFIENAKSFARPFEKSFQVRGVFILGGTFRHIMGYTRIRNLDLIQDKINTHPYWSKHVFLPRKWFWIPKDSKMLTVKGYKLGSEIEKKMEIPEIYALICDEIKESENVKKIRKSKIKEYLDLCNFLDLTLDPNPNNFKLDKNNNFVLIDTEHFTTLIGITSKIRKSHDYNVYYTRLVEKYLRDRWLTLKKDRLYRQQNEKTDFPLFI